jgi:AraC family transcriptional regulator
MSIETPRVKAGHLVRKAMSRLYTNHELAEHYLNEAAELLSVESAVSALDSAVKSRPTDLGLTRWQTMRVISYVDDNLGSKLTTSKLAKLLSLSSGYFSRLFRHSMGRSPMTYIAAKRIERCKSLMQSSAQPMCAIAMACGFADQPHFTRTFRRWVGMSPGAWRRVHARLRDGDRPG